MKNKQTIMKAKSQLNKKTPGYYPRRLLLNVLYHKNKKVSNKEKVEKEAKKITGGHLNNGLKPLNRRSAPVISFKNSKKRKFCQVS